MQTLEFPTHHDAPALQFPARLRDLQKRIHRYIHVEVRALKGFIIPGNFLLLIAVVAARISQKCIPDNATNMYVHPPVEQAHSLCSIMGIQRNGKCTKYEPVHEALVYTACHNTLPAHCVVALQMSSAECQKYMCIMYIRVCTVYTHVHVHVQRFLTSPDLCWRTGT